MDQAKDLEELKDTEELIYLKQLMKIGKVWSNYGHHRIYFDVPKLIITSLNGLGLLESDAKNIEMACLSGKLWYDIKTKQFVSRNLHVKNYNLAKLAMEAIDKLIESEFLLEDELFEI